MPARPPRIVVDVVVVVVVVVLTDVDASAERANDAIVYPLPRSSTPRAVTSSSFSDVVVVLCRRPSSFARSRTPGPRADDVDRSVGRSDPRRRRRPRPRGPYSSIDFTQRAIHFDSPLPRRARVRPSPYVVDARATRRVSRVRRSIASLRPGRYFDLICFDRRRRRSLSSASLVAPRTRTPRSSRNEERRVARATSDSSDSFVRFVRFVRSFAAPTIVGWRIGGLEDRAVPSCSVFRVPCSVFARAIDGSTHRGVGVGDPRLDTTPARATERETYRSAFSYKSGRKQRLDGG